jgi:hypothetical protein
MPDERQLEPQFTTGRIDNNDLAYEIQMAQASDGVWFQRHIWLHIPSLAPHEPRVDPWIVSATTGPGTHMKPVVKERA